MTEQARAARTRQRLVHNAAAEFAQRGYEGTSFARVCKAAGVTMGALTFHFPTKTSLAEAVCAEGIEGTRASVDDADRGAGSPLQAVGRIARAAAGALGEQAAAQASARLSREQPSLGLNWRDAWLPLIRTRLYQAQKLDELRPGTRPETATLLVASLVAGLEAGLLPQLGELLLLSSAPQEQLAELWQLTLRGIGTATPPGPPPTPWDRQV
ncbi:MULTISPECIES: TetR/AcrR family transcriptional regulator [unclassified Streptomyces]|uniref:TetR/AcrR family transcriptional regulator n=1 Tax=unclassified Streptomyces TaxID=2593676 RepID=UPI002E19B722|nr:MULTISPECIES: TetR/AcrR family transcriptional regulator [unclassified Streptomyces]